MIRWPRNLRKWPVSSSCTPVVLCVCGASVAYTHFLCFPCSQIVPSLASGDTIKFVLCHFDRTLFSFHNTFALRGDKISPRVTCPYPAPDLASKISGEMLFRDLILKSVTYLALLLVFWLTEIGNVFFSKEKIIINPYCCFQWKIKNTVFTSLILYLHLFMLKSWFLTVTIMT